MEAFKRQECQAAILCEKKQHVIAVLLRSSLWLVFYYTKFTFFKFHGTCCHFSFINKYASERRNCVYIPNSEALLSNLDDDKSAGIINVKLKQAQYLRLVYYNALQLSCYLLKLLPALLFLTLHCNFINIHWTKLWRIKYLCLVPLVRPYCVSMYCVTAIHMYMLWVKQIV